jgi:hypothetical protein
MTPRTARSGRYSRRAKLCWKEQENDAKMLPKRPKMPENITEKNAPMAHLLIRK